MQRLADEKTIAWSNRSFARVHGDDAMAKIFLESNSATGSDSDSDEERRRTSRTGLTVRIDYATVY